MAKIKATPPKAMGAGQPVVDDLDRVETLREMIENYQKTGAPSQSMTDQNITVVTNKSGLTKFMKNNRTIATIQQRNDDIAN